MELNSDLLQLLPVELISEILTRLPIRLLLQLRCFMDDPYLRKLYSDRVILASHSVGNPVSFLTLVQFNLRKDCQFHFAEYDDARTWYYRVNQPIRYPHLNSRDKGDMIVGSCNGLICYVERSRIKPDSIFILNPVTREQLDLTPLRFVRIRKSRFAFVVNGFGYDPVTKVYKVVRIYFNGQEDNAVGEVKVYTLGTGVWRSIGKVPSFINVFYRCFPGVLVNGALHWYDVKGCIASFDLAAETFDWVPSPPSVILEPDGSSWYSLCALQERLCVVDHFEDTRLDIWVLNRDQSWTMDFSVKIQIDPNTPLCSNDKSVEFDTCTPITLTKSGKLLLWYNHKMLASYDRENKEKRIYGEYKAGHFNEIVVHVKSFVSLKALGENTRIIRI